MSDYVISLDDPKGPSLRTSKISVLEARRWACPRAVSGGRT
jgi:hypothetical protein